MKPSILFCFVGLGAALYVVPPRPTKKFELNLTWDTKAPDGVERQQALINGQFPGPSLIFDEGDNVEVTVNNFLPFNTTMHWHGIEQQGTSWSDGVPGVSQRLIAPGGRFVSKFTATQYGTYWYHSHCAGQIMDGLYGPIYIRPRDIAANLASMVSNDTRAHFEINNAIRDPKLLMISDWFHNTSEELRDIAVSANLDTLCVDSILINGKGRVRCVDSAYLTSLTPAPLVPLLQGMNYTAKGCLPVGNTYAQTTFSQHNYTAIPPSMFDQCSPTESMDEVIKVDHRKGWISLNLIGSASISIPTVSINNHSLWVYEIDGRYIIPTKVDALTLSNGGRYSVLVQLNNTPGNYLITAANAGLNQKVAGYGTLSYVTGDPSVVGKPSINYGGNSMSTDVVVFDENKIKPLFPSRPSEEADQTYLLTIGRIEKAWKWSLNGDHSYGLSLESEKPMLWDPQSYEDSDLVIATKNDTWVDIVFAAFGNASTLQPGHPIHKHSNIVYILGAGMGEFKWTSVAEAQQEIPEMFNLVDPPMRDTFTTLPALLGPSWLAVRYHVQNPGAFFLHCHIDPHLTGGMALAILDGVDVWPSIPTQYGPEGHWGKAT
ncbi:Multicopper oxidase type 2 [Penicillium concentricum]|uniref:Multicopper oxidase type 2 n=1 Tax=Penicillium concentricum TaxID=293559 RepID=A0A9W9S8N6_9EURO|nr:Multicopper oxidase type 2 [Penicillium concentricum]KAJ5374028.1 Multicopper oxidase type 2 [Penicillium concentricum]